MPGGRRDEFQTITLTDFTPGIQSNWHSQLNDVSTYGQPAPDGAATELSTNGCYGLPNGGLAPLPRIAESIVDTLINATETLGNKPGTVSSFDFNRQVVLSTGIMSPVLNDVTGARWNGRIAPNNDFDTPDLLFVQYEWLYDTTGLGTNYQKNHQVRMFNRAKSTPSTLDLLGGSTALSGTVSGAVLGSSNFRYSRGSMEVARATNAVYSTTANIGVPQLAYLVNTCEGAAGTYLQLSWPNNSGIADTSSTLLSLVNPHFFFAHQGRLVVGFGLGTGTNGAPLGPEQGDAAGNRFRFVDGGTALGWSEPNNLTSGFELDANPFDADVPSGAGAWASMNANEAILIKDRGGAVVIRGDLAAPQRVRLPGVPSTYGAGCIPVSTPLGLIYGTRHGVWSWTGSDTAQLLSPNLDGWFWKPLASQFDTRGVVADKLLPLQPKGKFAYSHPWIFAPNNWVMDTRTGGWFRLSTTRYYAHYEVSANGSVYAIPPAISTTDGLTVADRYDPDSESRATSYQWRSQPLQRARGKRIQVREIEIVAGGLDSSTIQVQVYGSESSFPQSHTFTLSGGTDRPRVYRAQVSIVAHDAQVLVTATGAGGTNNAPTLYRLTLSYQEGTSV